MSVIAWLLQTVRLAVGAAFGFVAIVALTHWALRARWIQPFGPFPRLVQRGSAPLVRWMERRLLRSGGNPQDAPYWLLGLVVVGGLALIALAQWIVGFLLTLEGTARAGPRVLLAYLVDLTFVLLMGALFVRVVASWLGVSPYSRWMRPVIALTEWLLQPLRRVVPPLGMFDLTPVVAYLILMLLRSVFLRLM